MVGVEIKAPFLDEIPRQRNEGAAAQRGLAARSFSATETPNVIKSKTPGQNQMYEIRIWF